MKYNFNYQVGGSRSTKVWITFFICLFTAFWIFVIQRPHGWPIKKGIFFP